MRLGMLTALSILLVAGCDAYEPSSPLRLPAEARGAEVGLVAPPVVEEVEQDLSAPAELPQVLDVDFEPHQVAPTPAPTATAAPVPAGIAAAASAPKTPKYTSRHLRKVAEPRARPTGPTVELVKAGSGELAPLRFKVEAGHVERVELSMELDLDIELGGQRTPKVQLPPLVMVLELTVESAIEDGDIRYRVRAEDVHLGTTQKRIDRRVRQALVEALEPLKSLAAVCVMNDRGVVQRTEFDLGAGAPKEARELMKQVEATLGQVSAPLPIEPVGPGAVWKVHTRLPSQQGVEMYQTATYQLLRRDERGCSMLVSLEQTAPKQTVKSNELPPGARMSLDRLAGAGTGRIVMAPERLSPRSGTIRAATSFDFGLAYRGEEDTMKMKIGVVLEISTPR